MKNVIKVLLVSVLLLFPISVYAETEATNLEDTLKAENIDYSFTDYEESDDQVTIYMFRGTGCSHCQDFLNFISEHVDTYGEKFKLRAYEVYQSSDNQKLKDEVVDYFSLDAPGVPLIVVGENTFYGFSDETGDKILEAIDNEYAADDKFDVFKEIEEKKNSKNQNDALIILIPVLIVLIIFFIKKGNDKKNTSTKTKETVSKKVEEVKSEKIEPVVKEVKEVKKTSSKTTTSNKKPSSTKKTSSNKKKKKSKK